MPRSSRFLDLVVRDTQTPIQNGELPESRNLGETNGDIIEQGNQAAHRGNQSTDEALFK